MDDQEEAWALLQRILNADIYDSDAHDQPILPRSCLSWAMRRRELNPDLLDLSNFGLFRVVLCFGSDGSHFLLPSQSSQWPSHSSRQTKLSRAGIRPPAVLQSHLRFEI